MESHVDLFSIVPIKQEILDPNVNDKSCSDIACDSVEKQVGQDTNSSSEMISTKCVWCLQTLTSNDQSKLLECLHVSCTPCVTSKFLEIDKNIQLVINCPKCNISSQKELIIDNKFLAETINLNEENQSGEGEKTSCQVICSNCSDEATATSWCVDCSEYICENCVQAHHRLKITKDHTIKPKGEASRENHVINNKLNRSLMCSTHLQEKLSLFCETCDKLTCRDCQLENHRDHKYKFAHEIATDTRNQLTSLLSDINYKRFLLTSAKKVIEDRQSLIMERKKDMIKDITAMVVKITNTVNARGKQLAMRVNEVCDSKLKILSEKKEALQLLSDNTDHCIDFVSNALEKGSDVAVLYSKKSLARHLQKLKCQRADIPNPEIPVRLNIQLNQVSELQKVISQMGAILVDGKPYPSQSQLCNQPCQSISPNLGSLRPGLQSPALQQLSSSYQGGNTASTFQNGTCHAPSQIFSNIHLNRQFSGEAQRINGYSGLTNMPRQPGQSLVSSSTHPQNIANQNQSNLGFNNVNSLQNGVSQPNIQHQMRQHFMSGSAIPNSNHPCQNFQQSQIGSNLSPNNFMNSQSRFQNLQRINPNHLQNIPSTNAALVPTGVNSNVGVLRPMMQNSIAFGITQGSFTQTGQGNINVQLGLGNSSNQSVGAKWHIPQSVQKDSGPICYQQNTFSIANGQQRENFKISLKSQNSIKNTVLDKTTNNLALQTNGPANVLPNVSSTNPKTPSPIANDMSKDITEPIDRVREDSINDLMATIAKLDSNGVQVLPEGRNKTTSPQVHSSTDISNLQEEKNDMKDDPNEDWCAVCLDGGELMCCDKCPKVFHQSCHIPAISSLPDESETWQCLLCINMEYIIKQDEIKIHKDALSPWELKLIQRICLELYCQYEQSLPFRELEPESNINYYEIICKPISLDEIRNRLDPLKENFYKNIETFVGDIRLLFKNVHLFYQEDSKIFLKAKYLESFFDELLRKWLPSYLSVQPNDENIAMSMNFENDYVCREQYDNIKNSKDAKCDTDEPLQKKMKS